MYTFDSRIRYSEIDRSGRLSVPAVVDYFQDCSAFQSEELGVGVEYLANKKRAWILNSWQIVLERRPEECERSQLEHGDLDLTSFMQREILS